MSGLIALLVLVVWFVIVVAVVNVFAARIKSGALRFAVVVVAIAALLPMPLMDEYMGRSEFEKLCAANSEVRVDLASAAGKTVYLASVERVKIANSWLPIYIFPWKYVDSTTGEVVVAYNVIQATGGWLGRHASEGGVPFTFVGHCQPVDIPGGTEDFAKLGVVLIKRPENRNAR